MASPGERNKTPRIPTRPRGRPGVSSLPWPSPRFDLRNTPGFESAEKAADEDRRRAGRLRGQAKREPDKAEALRALADRIDPDKTRYPETLASARFMREQRIRVIGAYWQVIYEA